MSIGINLNDDVDVVWRPGEASEALDDEMEVTNKQRLIACTAHQEGAHVGLQELPKNEKHLLACHQVANFSSTTKI